MNERQMEKACKKEALEALKKQEKEQKAQQAEQDAQRNKAHINAQIDVMSKERDALVAEAVELRRTDPESAAYVIALGNNVDKAIKRARGTLAMANGQALQAKIGKLVDDSIALMRAINTASVQYTPSKERTKLRKQKQLHDMLVRLADEARTDELGIYMGGIMPSDGTGSAFEADVRAAEKKAEIDEFDD